jgi:ribonucleoside-diphosphate reductase alpha chain
VLAEKFSHTRYEPSGFTGNPDIPIAKSITDYIFRWLALKFLPREDGTIAVLSSSRFSPGAAPNAPALPAGQLVLEARASTRNGIQSGAVDPSVAEELKRAFEGQSDAPPCPTCGSITVRNGACYKCVNCGSTTGCS